MRRLKQLAFQSGEVPVEPAKYSPTVDSNRFRLEVPSLTHAGYLIRQANPADCNAALSRASDTQPHSQKMPAV